VTSNDDYSDEKMEVNWPTSGVVQVLAKPPPLDSYVVIEEGVDQIECRSLK
jgi:hypothetical protein